MSLTARQRADLVVEETFKPGVAVTRETMWTLIKDQLELAVADENEACAQIGYVRGGRAVGDNIRARRAK